MNRIGKLAVALCLVLAACVALGCALPARFGIVDSASAASGVKLNKTRATLDVGDTLRLKVSGTKRWVTWSSSNKCVAKVNHHGRVTALEPGTTKITARVGAKKLTCRITVNSPVIVDPTIIGPVIVMKKPILYLYPEEETELTVKLGRPEAITASYPAYGDGWRVSARPDGTLTDLDSGRSLYALYWEGAFDVTPAIDEGFVVAGQDTAAFLEEKLAALGLTEREAEEFIVYWLPNLQQNPYNLIRFERMEEIDAAMPLAFSVEPETRIRVFMVYRPLEEAVEIPEQVLPETPVRRGFTGVEWGGSELN